MFRTGSSPTENQHEPRTEAGNAIPGSSSHQSDESFTPSPTDSANPPRALAENAMIAREIREGTLSGFVGAGAKITADVCFKSLLRIDGLLSGRITSDEGTLVVAAAGRVEANVTVAIARINGTVTGDIVCSDRIELGAAAKVTGNIQAPALIIEHGAVLDGRCRITTTAELENVSEPATPAATETVAPVEAVAAPQVAVAESPAPQPAVVVQQEAKAKKARKIARKANVRASPSRARTAVARAKTGDSEPANGEQAAVAAG